MAEESNNKEINNEQFKNKIKQVQLNRTKKAVALAYAKGEQAPKVIASGKGHIADKIIDIGPGAGVHGGRIMAQGTAEEIKNVEGSITGDYLSGRKKIHVPSSRRKGNKKNIEIVEPMVTIRSRMKESDYPAMEQLAAELLA